MNSTFLIGHLDSGSPPNHPRLDGKIIESIAFNETGDFQEEPLKSSQYSHSSLSARIIFEDDRYSLPALNSKTQLASVSISSRGKTILNFLKGMDYLLDLAPQIVCMPIGFRQPIPIFYPMISAFHNKGIHTIIPIGNNGIGKAHVPGCYPNVISVGAIDATGKVTRYSGSYLDDSGNCLKPDILAQGNSLSVAGASTKKGTSFACSYIAGITARLLQSQPSATSEEIRQALYSTTQPLDTSQRNRCKRGVVQPDAALEFLLQNKNSTPTPQQESIPSFLREPYKDKRFLSQLKNTKPDSLLEAIIIPNPNIGKLMDAQDSSPLSHHLILNIQKASGLAPDYCHYFIHADMAHIRARVSFFEVLLKHPSLFTISAVDVNIFEM